jgi:hypothetical protein
MRPLFDGRDGSAINDSSQVATQWPADTLTHWLPKPESRKKLEFEHLPAQVKATVTSGGLTLKENPKRFQSNFH